jgi:hypothetical protein
MGCRSRRLREKENVTDNELADMQCLRSQVFAQGCRIARLEADLAEAMKERDELRAAISPVARWAEATIARREGERDCPLPDHHKIIRSDDVDVTAGDLRALIAAAIEEEEAPGARERAPEAKDDPWAMVDGRRRKRARGGSG